MLPDHSVLLLSMEIRDSERTESHNTNPGEICSPDVSNNQIPDHYFKRYKITGSSENFLMSDSGRVELNKLIEEIVRTRHEQEHIDSTYDTFVDTFQKEMSKLYNSKDIHPSAKKRLRKRSKPFWNDELKSLWNNLCASEKLYLKASGSERSRLLNKFRSDQKLFVIQHIERPRGNIDFRR